MGFHFHPCKILFNTNSDSVSMLFFPQQNLFCSFLEICLFQRELSIIKNFSYFYIKMRKQICNGKKKKVLLCFVLVLSRVTSYLCCHYFLRLALGGR